MSVYGAGWPPREGTSGVCDWPSSPWQDRQLESRCSASEPAEAETAGNKIANCNAKQNVVTHICLAKWNLDLSGQTGESSESYPHFAATRVSRFCIGHP